MSLPFNDQNANGEFSYLPKTQSQAKKQGVKHFFDGTACKNGHISKRYASNGVCTVCGRIRLKELREGYKVEGFNSYNVKTSHRDPSWLKNAIEHENPKRFYGKPCPKCGLTERYKINGRCLNCCFNAESAKKWALENKERTRENKRAWLKKNAKKIYVYNSSKEKRLREAMPPWLTDNDKLRMDQIYLDRQDGYHVDHIIPIRGKNVCGLHVYWNMQYMTTAANIGKTNKLLDEYADCTATVARDGSMTDLRDYVAELVADKPEILIQPGQVWRWKGDNRTKLVVIEGDNGMSGAEKIIIMRTLVRDNGKPPEKRTVTETAALRFKIRYELPDIVNNS